ncbi:MAG: alpha/beta hydrolase [Pleurocapsa sp.]
MTRITFSTLSVSLIQITCCLAFPYFWATKAAAAEEIYLNYGLLEFSLTVDSLEAYARQGLIQDELKTYARYLTPEQLEKLKVALTTSADLSPLAISQFLYSYQGKKILERVGKVVQTTARQPGFYAIRSALILAAADEDSGGLTPLNILKKFPTQGIRIDSARGFEIIENLSKIVQESAKAISAVEAAAQEEARTTNLSNYDGFPSLLKSGNFNYRKQLLTLRDTRRRRRFPVNLYLPNVSAPNNKSLLPLIVISHGLGSDRSTFDYLAKHLASYGFAVAVPEHPGSNANQIQDLLSGLDNDVTPPKELIDRPLDIKFLLDELTKDYGNQIDTQNVGIIGQSFGAYTALALAGAELNFDALESNCSDLDESWNLSLLLQCLALDLPPQLVNLRDERIVAAIAINPLTSAVFGKESLSQIDIPVMLVAGSADPVTPALSEQIIPFTWLDNSQKYLALLKGGTHFSTLNESSGSIPVPEQAIGPDPKIAQAYIKQLGLAFFGAYVTNNLKYQDYLSADYATRISNQKMPLSLVRSLDEQTLQLNSTIRP